jgi:hypothetical protein
VSPKYQLLVRFVFAHLSTQYDRGVPAEDDPVFAGQVVLRPRKPLRLAQILSRDTKGFAPNAIATEVLNGIAIG